MHIRTQYGWKEGGDEKAVQIYKNDTPILVALANVLCPLGFVREFFVIFDQAGSRYRLDFAQPDEKINIEFDGTGHLGNIQQKIDALRDARLHAKGWVIIRIVSRPNTADGAGLGYAFLRPSIVTPKPELEALYPVLDLCLQNH